MWRALPWKDLASQDLASCAWTPAGAWLRARPQRNSNAQPFTPLAFVHLVPHAARRCLIAFRGTETFKYSALKPGIKGKMGISLMVRGQCDSSPLQGLRQAAHMQQLARLIAARCSFCPYPF